MSEQQRSPHQLPEIPSSTPLKIAEFIDASGRTSVSEFMSDMEDVMTKPLLGEKGHAQSLFRRFNNESQRLSRGYRALTIKVFPSPPSRFDKEVLRALEGNAIVFNDELAGYNIELRHLEGRGVVAFNIMDDQESGDKGAYAGIIMLRDGSSMGVASLIDQGEVVGYRFRTTVPAEVVLSSVAKMLLDSEGLEESIEDQPS